MERSTLTELMEKQAFGQTPADLVTALASAWRERMDGTVMVRFVSWAQALGESLSASIQTDLDSYLTTYAPTEIPAGYVDQKSWLQAVEEISLASFAVVMLPEGLVWRNAVYKTLFNHDDRMLLAIKGHSLWMHSGTAAQAMKDLGTEIHPWDAIHSGASQGIFKRPPEEADEVFVRWSYGQLDEVDICALQAIVREPGPWQDAYRVWVAGLAREIHAGKYNPAWSYDMATQVVEIQHEPVMPAFTLWLPHLPSRAGDFSARLHTEGVLIHDPTAPPERRLLILPWDAADYRWGDDVTGPIVTRLSVYQPDSWDETFRATVALRILEEVTELDTRAKRVLTAIAADLESGGMLEGLRMTDKASRDNFNDQDGVFLEWACCLADAYNRLHGLAHKFKDQPLIERVARIAVVIQPHVRAFWFLDVEGRARHLHARPLGELPGIRHQDPDPEADVMWAEA